jgi:hypothetical protein
MRIRRFACLAALFLGIASVSWSQITDPMLYQRWNVMNINRLRTKFNNTGQLCDGNEQIVSLARPPAFEYPHGSGLNWGQCVAIVMGAPGIQDTGAVGGTNPLQLEYCDGAMDEGPAAYWDPEHFAPYPEVVNPSSSDAPISTDSTTWPTAGPQHGWPALIPGTTDPLVVGPEGWPGLGAGGKRVADQETYSVMYAFRGRKTGTGDDRRWLRAHVEMRGMAWTGELYQDFIVWHFVIRNIGTAPITGMRIGIHSDFGYLPYTFNQNGYHDDRHYFEPATQLAYGTAAVISELDPRTGGALDASQIAWSGSLPLRMPGPTRRAKTYDAFHFWVDATTSKGNGASKELYFRYNLANLYDPRDSDKDGVDDDFNMDGVPDTLEGLDGRYTASGADGLQVLGSDSLTLAPGQSDTLIFATVFGMTRAQLFKNCARALTLYHSGWIPVKAPEAPAVEIKAGDGRDTVYWSRVSELESKFEGYKIYRSVDGGVIWGTDKFTDFSGTTRYIPLAQYDRIDQIAGHYTSLPEFAWFDLGSETGLPRTKVVTAEDQLTIFKPGDTVRVFVDDQVINGMRYRYYVAAYDTGNGITGPLENTPASDPKVGTNTVEVVPRAPTATNSVSQVRVVPNPYVVASGWEQGKEHQVQFTHLPERATIRIFNVAGELVRTLDHSAASAPAPSIEPWDLKNENNQLVAAGLYFYHLDSPVGSTRGKFIIIQ